MQNSEANTHPDSTLLTPAAWTVAIAAGATKAVAVGVGRAGATVATVVVVAVSSAGPST